MATEFHDIGPAGKKQRAAMMKRWGDVLLLLCCSGISIAWGWHIQASSPANLADFKAIYYGARCIIAGKDPYRPADFMQVYVAGGNSIPTGLGSTEAFRRAVPICINLPTALFLLTPLAYLPWSIAHVCWNLLEAGAIMTAAFLALDLAGLRGRNVSLLLICLLLANCEQVLQLGNLGVLVISATVAAVWCFEREKLIGLGVFLLTLAVVTKPHDAGPVWLALLIWPGQSRKGAAKALLLALVVGVLALIWISPSAPRWMSELRSNIALTSQHGDLNDPGPQTLNGNGPGMIIDLQSALSYFRDDPSFYNKVTYWVCGILLCAWLIGSWKIRSSAEHRLFALGAIVPITLLITYHRAYDSKLLLIAVPACVMLWLEGGVFGWLVTTITAMTCLLAGDLFLGALAPVDQAMGISSATSLNPILKIILTRPEPLVLLAMAVLYLVALWSKASVLTKRKSEQPITRRVQDLVSVEEIR